MKILDKIKLKTMFKNRATCPRCLGRGYVLTIRPDLDASKFREVRPCLCVKQVVRIEEDDR